MPGLQPRCTRVCCPVLLQEWISPVVSCFATKELETSQIDFNVSGEETRDVVSEEPSGWNESNSTTKDYRSCSAQSPSHRRPELSSSSRKYHHESYAETGEVSCDFMIKITASEEKSLQNVNVTTNNGMPTIYLDFRVHKEPYSTFTHKKGVKVPIPTIEVTEDLSLESTTTDHTCEAGSSYLDGSDGSRNIVRSSEVTKAAIDLDCPCKPKSKPKAEYFPQVCLCKSPCSSSRTSEFISEESPLRLINSEVHNSDERGEDLLDRSALELEEFLSETYPHQAGFVEINSCNTWCTEANNSYHIVDLNSPLPKPTSFSRIGLVETAPTNPALKLKNYKKGSPNDMVHSLSQRHDTNKDMNNNNTSITHENTVKSWSSLERGQTNESVSSLNLNGRNERLLSINRWRRLSRLIRSVFTMGEVNLNMT